MRTTSIVAYGLLSLALLACSGVEIERTRIDAFTAGNYLYYSWRTEPLKNEAGSSDPLYIIDQVMRREVDASLQSKGYVLDPGRAQFTVSYLFMAGMVQGERSELASNVTPYPRVMPNRQIDQASVDNAIALGGVKETNNIVLQFNDRANNIEVWQVTMTKIVENANSTDASRIDALLRKALERALQPLPPVSRQ